LLPAPLFIKRRPGWSAFCIGALAALGQAPVALPWVTLAGLAALCWLHLLAETPREALRRGWAFGAGYFALALHWIVEPFFVDIALHGWLAPFALAGMAGGLALFWGAAAWLAKRLAPRGLPGALGWAAALGLAELARSYVFTGFPWALIGHVWIGWPPMQLAAWVGPIGLTLATLIGPALAVALRRQRAALLGALFLFAGLYPLGLALDRPVPGAPGPIVRLVQPNAPQHLKWHPDHLQTFFDRQVRATAAPAEARPDLIVWPETAVPSLLHHADLALEIIGDAAQGVPVVLGIQRYDAGADQFFNSLVALDRQGAVAQIYDKHHLVPFGEYMPLPWLFEKINVAGLAARAEGGYTPGPGARLLDLGVMGNALPLICYEAVFPQDVNAGNGLGQARPDVLLHITNDAWFGQWVGPYQHLAQARLRAVEQGLPLIRAANTGVSAVIDARGEIVAQLGLGETGFLDAALPPGLPRATLYARTGDWLATLMLVLLLSAAIGLARAKGR
jgi:apolipoprotein N-acyltransferase